jgi:hypothetical protein
MSQWVPKVQHDDGAVRLLTRNDRQAIARPDSVFSFFAPGLNFTENSILVTNDTMRLYTFEVPGNFLAIFRDKLNGAQLLEIR